MHKAACDARRMIRGILFFLSLTPALMLPAAPPALPKALTSFGSATCDGSVYVYGFVHK